MMVAVFAASTNTMGTPLHDSTRGTNRQRIDNGTVQQGPTSAISFKNSPVCLAKQEKEGVFTTEKNPLFL